MVTCGASWDDFHDRHNGRENTNRQTNPRPLKRVLFDELHPAERILTENTNHSIAGNWNAVGDVGAVAAVAGVGAAGFARRLHHEVAAEVGPVRAAAAAKH